MNATREYKLCIIRIFRLLTGFDAKRRRHRTFIASYKSECKKRCEWESHKPRVPLYKLNLTYNFSSSGLL